MRIIDDLDYQSTQQATPVSTTGELINARFESSFLGGPVKTTSDRLRLNDLNQSQYQEGPTTVLDAIFGPKTTDDNYDTRRTENKTLTRDEAMSKAKAAGVKVEVPAAGMSEAGVDLLIKRRTEEAKREFVFATAEKNFTNTVAGFAGDFAGMMVDPLNVASAFVPVVGEARYGAWLARAGGLLERTAIRGGVGAAEGFVGSVALEPFILSNRQALQDDYDIYDSMNNIAAGTFFGSALHAGAGMFGDAYHGYKGTSPEWVKYREKVKAGDTTGKPPVLSELDIKTAKQQLELLDALSEVSLPRTGMEALSVINARLAELQDAVASKLPEAQASALIDELATLKATAESDVGVAARIAEIEPIIEKHNLAVKSEAELPLLKAESEKITKYDDYAALAEKISPINKKYYELRASKGLTPENKKALEADPYKDIRPIMAQLSPDTQYRMARAAVAQVADGRPVDVAAILLSDPKLADLPGVRAEVVRMAKENNQAFAKAAVKASQESDARLAEMKGSDDELANEKASATEEQSSLKDYMKRIGIEEDETVANLLAAADKDIANARSAGNAAKQAAACLMGAL